MIRRFRETDAEAVMRIWLAGNEDAHPFIPAAYWRSHFSAVREQIMQAELWVCEQVGEIQGFIGLAGDYIAGIFVDGTWRSRGIGRQLLDCAKREHPALSLHVYEKNRRAAAFYAREGFSVCGKERGADTGEAEYLMEWKQNFSSILLRFNRG